MRFACNVARRMKKNLETCTRYLFLALWHRRAHTHIVLVSHWGRFGCEPVRCRGDWAAWGSPAMFASTSGSLALHLTPRCLARSLYCSPSVSLTRSFYLIHSSVHFFPLFHTHTHSLSLSVSFPFLKSLAFLPYSLPPFKQQKAISLPLSGRLAVSP